MRYKNPLSPFYYFLPSASSAPPRPLRVKKPAKERPISDKSAGEQSHIAWHAAFLKAIQLKIRGYKVEETNPGIYTVTGDVLPIQIIDSRKLSADENIWLRDLGSGLEVIELQRVLHEALKQPKDARIDAYIDAITRANFNTLEEVISMSSTAKSLEEVLERTGMAAKLEERAEARVTAKVEERNSLAIAKNMINMGLPLETIVTATMLDPEKVRGIMEK